MHVSSFLFPEMFLNIVCFLFKSCVQVSIWLIMPSLYNILCYILLSQPFTSLRYCIIFRSASRHSKGATNAFLRGDHFSARHHSMKAQENSLNAQELNAKAAKEILSIRNSDNDIWRLDLHGLHASEAIEALQEHLHRIESLGSSKNSSGLKDNDGIVNLTSGSVKQNLEKQRSPIKFRSSALEVITGLEYVFFYVQLLIYIFVLSLKSTKTFGIMFCLC